MSEQETIGFAGLIIVWVFMCVIGFLIGRTRGKGPEGLGLAFLLGPLGWLIVLCLTDARRKCASCKGVVPVDAKVCMHCRAELS